MEQAHCHVKTVTEVENYHAKHVMDLEEVLLANMNAIFAEDMEAIHATFATVAVTTHAIYVMEQGTFNIYYNYTHTISGETCILSLSFFMIKNFNTAQHMTNY